MDGSNESHGGGLRRWAVETPSFDALAKNDGKLRGYARKRVFDVLRKVWLAESLTAHNGPACDRLGVRGFSARLQVVIDEERYFLSGICRLQEIDMEITGMLGLQKLEERVEDLAFALEVVVNQPGG